MSAGRPAESPSEGEDAFVCCVCGESKGSQLFPVPGKNWLDGYAYEKRWSEHEARITLACGHDICLRCLHGWMYTCARQDFPTTCPLDRSVIDFDRKTIWVPKKWSAWPKTWPVLEPPSWSILRSARLTQAFFNTRYNWPFQTSHSSVLQRGSTVRVVYAQTGSPTVLCVEVNFDHDQVSNIIDRISDRIGVPATRLILRFRRAPLAPLDHASVLRHLHSPLQLIIQK